MRKIRKIIIHCSATQEGKDVSVETIRKWHLKRGWRDIGYHFVIGLDGQVHEGRPIEETGAHTKGHNLIASEFVTLEELKQREVQMEKWVAKDTRTDEQKEALDDMLCYLKIMSPQAKVYGHNDFSSKSCPCFDAQQEYEWISNQF